MKTGRALLWTLLVAAVLAGATAAGLWAARSGWGLPGALEQPVPLPPDHPAARSDRNPFH